MASEYKKTVKPSGQGGNYTTLDACLTTEQQNLVGNDRYFLVEIGGDWTGVTDTTATGIDGYVTDSTRYIKIYTTGDARHNGVYGGNPKAYKHEVTNSSWGNFATNTVTEFIWVEGIQFKHTISSGAIYGCIALESHLTGSNGWMKASNNIVWGPMTYDANAHNFGILSEAYDCRVSIWNNIIYGFKAGSGGQGGITIYSCNTGNEALVYNNTIYEGNYGIGSEQQGSGVPILKNNICAGIPGVVNFAIPSAHANSTNNLSQDDTAPTVGTYYHDKTVTFAGAGDFHLSDSDTEAKGKGANLYSDGSLAITTDIDGNTQPSAGAWDIGADHYVETTIASSLIGSGFWQRRFWTKGFWGQKFFPEYITTGAKILAADAGSFALTGTVAALKKGYRLSAESGSFSQAGTAATLKAARKVVAVTGSFALTDTAAGVKKGYKIGAEAGSYGLTGTAAALKKGRTLVADAGSFAVTGTDSSFKRTYRLSAGGGSFALSGTQAGLERGYKVSAGPGAFSLSGQNVGLRKGTGLVAAPGSFALSGTAATFKRGYVIKADAGTYALNGIAASLKRGYKVSAALGSFSIAGPAVGLLKGRGLVAASGNFSISGTAVTFKRTYRLSIEAGCFTQFARQPENSGPDHRHSLSPGRLQGYTLA